MSDSRSDSALHHQIVLRRRVPAGVRAYRKSRLTMAHAKQI